MSKLVANKKAAWARQFQPKLIKGAPVGTNAGVSAWYAVQLEGLAAAMHEATQKELLRLFRAEGSELGFSQDASLASQARILLNKLRRRFGSVFEQKALSLAESMLRRSNRANASAVHESLKELSGGLSIKTSFISGKLAEQMKAAVTENVSYIRSIRSEYHTQLEGAVMRSITSGNGLADLVPELQKLGEVTRTRAHFIALDQTKRANAFLTRQRLADAGVTHFRWIYTGRSKIPREFHRDVLANRVFRLDDPPVVDPKTNRRGFPGDLINCRCEMEPVIKFGEGEDEYI